MPVLCHKGCQRVSTKVPSLLSRRVPVSWRLVPGCHNMGVSGLLKTVPMYFLEGHTDLLERGTSVLLTVCWWVTNSLLLTVVLVLVKKLTVWCRLYWWGIWQYVDDCVGEVLTLSYSHTLVLLRLASFCCKWYSCVVVVGASVLLIVLSVYVGDSNANLFLFSLRVVSE